MWQEKRLKSLGLQDPLLLLRQPQACTGQTENVVDCLYQQPGFSRWFGSRPFCSSHPIIWSHRSNRAQRVERTGFVTAPSPSCNRCRRAPRVVTARTALPGTGDLRVPRTVRERRPPPQVSHRQRSALPSGGGRLPPGCRRSGPDRPSGNETTQGAMTVASSTTAWSSPSVSGTLNPERSDVRDT